jgi:hypothetical protein
MRKLIPLLTLLAACGTPGSEVRPEATDFAFIEVSLKG